MSRFIKTIKQNSQKIAVHRKAQEAESMMTFQARADTLKQAEINADRRFAVFSIVMLAVLILAIGFLGLKFADLISSTIGGAMK